ncbi:Protein root UVB sensitive 1, chloroplastic [Galdieria sulphuraria]|nr:Protein root UVB sensitive 1, chloroplastic [Galdieria sulphuraria]
MRQRRVSPSENFKRETPKEPKNELSFLIPSIHLCLRTRCFDRFLIRLDRSTNFLESYSTNLLKNNLKSQGSFSRSSEKFFESGSSCNRRIGRRALKDAKTRFPLSKVFLIVFGDHKKFILSGISKSMLKDTIFFTSSGCSFLDVPFAAHTLRARHVFAAACCDILDVELYKVRHLCFGHGIYLHVSTGSYSARSLLMCVALLLDSRSRLSAFADSSSTIWERNLRRGSIVPYQFSDDMIQEGRFKDDRPIFEKLIDWLSRVYLPDGYPNSVTKDYLSYSIWRAIQNLAASVMGVFATEALLFGLGLGRKSTPATSAAISWVLKDGLGYIGKVFYGSIAGNQFDVDPKSWRLAADAVEDAGGVLEIITPLFPGHFLLLASVANAMKGVAAMTGTATRHAIYKSLALHENQGDIATKGESQGVTCKMVGLGLGIVASSKMGQNYFALLSAYALGCFVHLFANWKSLSCVQFATLNRQRCSLALQEFLQTGNVPSPIS